MLFYMQIIVQHQVLCMTFILDTVVLFWNFLWHISYVILINNQIKQGQNLLN